MVINVIVQYNGGSVSYILLLTQAPVFCMVRWHYYLILLLYPLNYVLQCLLFCYASWLCIVINISVQYNGGLLPDTILLIQGYYY